MKNIKNIEVTFSKESSNTNFYKSLAEKVVEKYQEKTISILKKIHGGQLNDWGFRISVRSVGGWINY